MSSRRQFIGAGATTVALAALATRPLPTRADDDDDDDDNGGTRGPRVVGTPIFRPEIDFIRAQEIALEGNDGAHVTKVELDGEDGLLSYEVYLDTGREVEIDATSGAVIRMSDDDDDDDDRSGGTSTAEGDDGDDG